MIRSLRLGKLHKVDALIELMNNEILLESVQTKPHYHNEELTFSLKGELLRVRKIKDVVADNIDMRYPRSESCIELYHGLGLIKTLYPEQNKAKNIIDFTIEQAYTDDFKGYYELLKSRNIENSQKQLKDEMLKTMEKIKNFDYKIYMLYRIITS